MIPVPPPQPRVARPEVVGHLRPPLHRMGVREYSLESFRSGGATRAGQELLACCSARGEGQQEKGLAVSRAARRTASSWAAAA